MNAPMDMQPCKRGHTDGRYASGHCITCRKEEKKRRYWANPEPQRERGRKGYWKDPERSRNVQREWKRANPNKVAQQVARRIESGRSKEAGAKWRANNPDKQRALTADWYRRHREEARARMRSKYDPAKQKERRQIYLSDPENKKKATLACARWAKSNPEKCCERVARRSAMQRRATPTWLTTDQIKEMEEIYFEARKRAQTVDHIIPIGGCRVCHGHGLHVPWNLQLLTSSDNSAKNARCNLCWSST